MRRVLLAATLIATACTVVHDPPRDTSAVAPAGATPAVPPADAAASGAHGALAANDPWLPAADSAIRRLLDTQLFLATAPSGFDRCSDDDGSENPTIGAAAVSARPLRRTRAELDPVSYGSPMRRAEYEVEVRSVAILVPQWIAKFPLDSTMQHFFPYQGVIGARTDTFSVYIGQVADSAGRGGWDACDPTGPAVSEGDGPGFWHFAHASDQANPDLRVVRWLPAGGSWARVVALADSAGKAKE